MRALLRLPLYEQATSLALGDAASDLPMLQAVGPGDPDARSRRASTPRSPAALPAAEHAPAPGPRGWNAAVLTVLEGGVLPRAAA